MPTCPAYIHLKKYMTSRPCPLSDPSLTPPVVAEVQQTQKKPPPPPRPAPPPSPPPTTIVLKVKHAVLTGSEPFVPLFRDFPNRVYSEERTAGGRTFIAYVESNLYEDPTHYGFFLCLRDPARAGPCQVTFTLQLMHHGGAHVAPMAPTAVAAAAAAAAVVASPGGSGAEFYCRMTLDRTSWVYSPQVGFSARLEAPCWPRIQAPQPLYSPQGRSQFVPKARLASAANNPFVKDGYVTFTCTVEVVA